MTSNQSETMFADERRSAVSLASIYSFRMLGLFMILPVFSLYAHGMKGVTPTMIGLALGIYGLTQAILQIPFGMLSDRIGRKPIITLGLLIFIVGSIVAALATHAHNMTGIIIGRALQGGGAVGSAVLALAADLTREEHRLKVMATIGMTIGVSFAIAMVGGPLINNWVGLSGIFWLTAILGLTGIVVLHVWVPNPKHSRLHRDTEAVPAQFKDVLSDGQLLRLDLGIFTMHLVLTAVFVALPVALRDIAGLPADHHWYVYLPVMAIGFFTMVPFIIIAEKKRRMKQIFAGAIALLGLANLSLFEFHHSLTAIVIALWLFFTAFNLLEASLPSLVSKMAPAQSKGTAMGVYSSSQFLGIFVGGSVGGWMFQHYGFNGVFLFSAAMVGLWLVAALTMQSPRYLTTFLLNVGEIDPARAKSLGMELARVQGVAEAVVIAEDQVAYLKVDNKALDKDALLAYSAAVPD
ncbi:MAG: MFS transporter [Gammaproteobacteria bacterium]